MEDEESRKIAVDVNVVERKAALDHCAKLGFTLANTPGVDEIKPRALGMKGLEVDFEAIEVRERRSTIRSKATQTRVDLGEVSKDARTEYIPSGAPGKEAEQEGFIKLDVGEGQDFEALNYNHKLRRKLRRAIDDAEVRKELLVRQRALDHYINNNEDPPSILLTPPKPLNVKGQRILENGTLESAKQERVRTRMELTEYNTAAKVLRKQAKQFAMEAGLRKHAEVTGKLPSTDVFMNTRDDSFKGYIAANSAKADQLGVIAIKSGERTGSNSDRHSDNGRTLESIAHLT